MGKVTEIELPKDHPILKAGWSLATIKRPEKSNQKNNNKQTNDKKINNEKIGKNL